jgi:rRNA maturation RNase YbeY
MIEFFAEDLDLDLAIARRSVPSIEAIAADYGMELKSLNVIFVTDEELLEVNREFLEHDYFTDIITFNYGEEDTAVEGELYISVDRVKENAEDVGVNFEDELLRVILHGVLHLAGMDDSTAELRMSMQDAENKYISMISSTWNMNKQA